MDDGKQSISLLTDYDVYLFKEGNHFHSYNQLGAHILNVNGIPGTYFAVVAPNAEKVSVIGDFNGWDPSANLLNMRNDGSGIWEGFIPGVKQGNLYKYKIRSKYNNFEADKTDPHGFFCEVPPQTGSIVWDLSYEWNDADWMKKRKKANSLHQPMSVYEMHIGSWKRVPEQNDRFLTYRELAPQLTDYLKEMGFTHVEFMPIAEHPYFPSWGYQVGCYFAPTSRYGTPQDFMYLIDYLHQNGIGVIIDWVPSHFPADGHGLVYFDGTHLYEHADTRVGFHPEWKTYIFNYGRNEVRNFLISNAIFWLDKYHIDGLRVDAVASMLYLDYARKDGQWLPNEYGGRENIKAINFIKSFNEAVYKNYPDVQTIAEESTAWAMVSRPTYAGGLGFGMKWNMGWMHDTLEYIEKEPIHRKYHHNQLTFSIWYAFYENFVLPLSHDEVVHGKGSLLRKMPGDEWQRFSNLRLLFGYMFTHPGKKLLFMGMEFGQWREWNCGESLDWHLTQHEPHQKLSRCISDLNQIYQQEPALYEEDFSWKGFEWIDFTDADNSIISFIRWSKNYQKCLIFVCNFTPIPRFNYRVGVPYQCFYQELFNSDSELYYGSNLGNGGGKWSDPVSWNSRPFSLDLTLPPLSTLILKPV